MATVATWRLWNAGEVPGHKQRRLTIAVAGLPSRSSHWRRDESRTRDAACRWDLKGGGPAYLDSCAAIASHLQRRPRQLRNPPRTDVGEGRGPFTPSDISVSSKTRRRRAAALASGSVIASSSSDVSAKRKPRPLRRVITALWRARWRARSRRLRTPRQAQPTR